MNLHKRFALSLALVTLLGITAAAANAEMITRGNFTLPEQAYWGNTLLPAGDYSLSVEKEPSGVNLVFVRGESFLATFMVPAGAGEASGRSCLKLDDINGTNVIRELDAGLPAKSYKFGVTKQVREMTLRGSAGQPATIPVSANGGF